MSQNCETDGNACLDWTSSASGCSRVTKTDGGASGHADQERVMADAPVHGGADREMATADALARGGAGHDHHEHGNSRFRSRPEAVEG